MGSAQGASQVSFDVLKMLCNNHIAVCASPMRSDTPTAFGADSDEPSFSLPTCQCLGNGNELASFVATYLCSRHFRLTARKQSSPVGNCNEIARRSGAALPRGRQSTSRRGIPK